MAHERTYQTVANLIPAWRENIHRGVPPVCYSVGAGFDTVEICPGKITLLGGAPGSGKTALVMQFVVDALRAATDLRAVVCNVEMPPCALLDRQLARLSGVDGRRIRLRVGLGEYLERIERGVVTLAELGERLCFLEPPFELKRVARAAEDFGAELLVVDYLQRLSPEQGSGDQRSAVNSAMQRLRHFTEAGRAVIVVAAVGRTRDQNGRSSYDGDGLNLASFRESSELEYGADDAYLLVPTAIADDAMILRHVKSRYGSMEDLQLQFHRACQRFTVLAPRPVLEFGGLRNIAEGARKCMGP